MARSRSEPLAARGSIRGFAALILRLHVLLLVVGCVRPAIDVSPVSLQTPDGVARGLVAVIDLSRVDIVVSDGDEQTAQDGRFPLQTTFDFAHETQSDLAFNANYFGDWREGRAAVLGLVISNGVVLNQPRKFNDKADPAIVLWDNHARVFPHYDGSSPRTEVRRTSNALNQIGSNSSAMLAELILPPSHGFAGIGPSASDSDPGTLLIADGENLGATARTVPSERNPRTAIGITRDGFLLVVVIDGRQPGHSVGVTLPELAKWMIKQGVTAAVNLDGGGSSSFVYRNPDGSLRTNRPSDGDFRPVAVSVGIIDP